jgi:hypothetical protein
MSAGSSNLRAPEIAPPASEVLRAPLHCDVLERHRGPYLTNADGRYLRIPAGWSRRQAVIRIEAVDVEVSGKGAAQGTRASQPPRQSEHLNIVDSPERAVNQTCLVLRGEIQREP